MRNAESLILKGVEEPAPVFSVKHSAPFRQPFVPLHPLNYYLLKALLELKVFKYLYPIILAHEKIDTDPCFTAGCYSFWAKWL